MNYVDIMRKYVSNLDFEAGMETFETSTFRVFASPSHIGIILQFHGQAKSSFHQTSVRSRQTRDAGLYEAYLMHFTWGSGPHTRALHTINKNTHTATTVISCLQTCVRVGRVRLCAVTDIVWDIMKSWRCQGLAFGSSLPFCHGGFWSF